MMKIISCFIPPTQGKVWVNGIEIAEDSMAVRKLIGYLPESNPLYFDMYVKEYLSFVCGLYSLEKDADQRVAKMIEITGLGREQHKQIGQLSKGYKQRVGIAQALIHDPEILILDEPTSGLDPNQLVDIRELIRTLGKEKTVMFSSHIMQEVEAVSDRVVIIDKGKIVTDRKVKDLQERSVVQVVSVEFDRGIEESALRAIKGITLVQKTGENVYRIEGKTEEDLRKSVSNWARQHDLLVLSLRSEEQKLEDLFRKHTT